MKKSRFSEQQIAMALEQARSGLTVEEVCRRIGISQNTFYRWRRRYGSIQPSEIKRLKQLEEENRRLKSMVADHVASGELGSYAAAEGVFQVAGTLRPGIGELASFAVPRAGPAVAPTSALEPPRASVVLASGPRFGAAPVAAFAGPGDLVTSGLRVPTGPVLTARAPRPPSFAITHFDPSWGTPPSVPGYRWNDWRYLYEPTGEAAPRA